MGSEIQLDQSLVLYILGALSAQKVSPAASIVPALHIAKEALQFRFSTFQQFD